MDFTDLISSQEINRLSKDVLRLEAEVSNWSHFAQTSIARAANSLDHNEIFKLKNVTKELQQKQNKENNRRLKVVVV